MNSKENVGFNPDEVVKPDDFEDGKIAVDRAQVGTIMERLRREHASVPEIKKNQKKEGDDDRKGSNTSAVAESYRPMSNQEKDRKENKKRLDQILASVGCDFRFSVLTGSSGEGYKFMVFLNADEYRKGEPSHIFAGARISEIENSIHNKFRED